MRSTDTRYPRMTLMILAVLFFGLSVFCWCKPVSRYSSSERRLLSSLPPLTRQDLLSGKFITEFETYAADQFPLRDSFRGIKNGSELKLFGKLDTNGLYFRKGYLAATEPRLNQDQIDYAAKRFRYLYEAYLKDTGSPVYLAIIPDKNYYLAKPDRLSMDYQELVTRLTSQTGFMTYINLFDTLSIEDYYRTDTHWRQECLEPVVQTLKQAMLPGINPSDNSLLAKQNTLHTLDLPFYGVYAGQLALPVSPDTLSYVTNAVLDQCVVTSYDTGRPVQIPMYTLEKAGGDDPYEIFLNGADPLLTIENKAAATDRELILFRDSFGSSLAPLLVQNYSKITLIDIRYVPGNVLGTFVDFHGQDVLFLYSTLVLNHSQSLR